MIPINKVSQVRLSSPFLSGLLYAFIMLIAGTIVTSLILLLSRTQESSLSTLAYITHGLSVFVGGWVAGKRAGRKGWYYGGMLGIFYALIVWIIGFLAVDTAFDLKTLTLAGFAFAAGALGGMIGVNSSSK
ncbi:TIGR04086 family membrane protein [Paenibacillus chitinolyticus]|uniref:TIGR04086 family membrane protein n=1 Tax=Paenibacillus chitinolyticus TaxID=79263 RepID=A0A410X1X8_9BACL|nr:TIGR04086 family membrane protein [Paenibacillus chitinolyticus]MCY9592712.1 TIGR04086 family membrane protein [Paenibacillus chitinolyticus]MCY9594685.1 TIGR04086 family membrane protein [Paenibacillus chitinolyticus]QAV20622.1 TIGR04086 family membrane protein [Paenibacillus chitinolyticus]